MKVGDLVLPDFPSHRLDWRSDWPDDMIGIIVEEPVRHCYKVMTPVQQEDVNIEYLVKVVWA